jgi:hypothetical protein
MRLLNIKSTSSKRLCYSISISLSYNSKARVNENRRQQDSFRRVTASALFAGLLELTINPLPEKASASAKMRLLHFINSNLKSSYNFFAR